jgi:hypothetical protein
MPDAKGAWVYPLRLALWHRSLLMQPLGGD